MFDKLKFKKLIEKAIGTSSITKYANECGVNRTYISKIINKKLANPPSPDILKKLANSSQDKFSYRELMAAAGYLEGIDLFSVNQEKINLNKIPIVKSFKSDIFSSDNIKGHKIINKKLSKPEQHFFIETKKSHLSHNSIKTGSLILINKNVKLKNGDIAALLLNEKESIHKIYFRDKDHIILADTLNSETTISAEKDIEIIGKCITIILEL